MVEFPEFIASLSVTLFPWRMFVFDLQDSVTCCNRWVVDVRCHQQHWKRSLCPHGALCVIVLTLNAQGRWQCVFTQLSLRLDPLLWGQGHRVLVACCHQRLSQHPLPHPRTEQILRKCLLNELLPWSINWEIVQIACPPHLRIQVSIS